MKIGYTNLDGLLSDCLDKSELHKRAFIVAEKLCLTDARYKATDTIEALLDSEDILVKVTNKYGELVEFERIPVITFMSDTKLLDYMKLRKMD